MRINQIKRLPLVARLTLSAAFIALTAALLIPRLPAQPPAATPAAPPALSSR